VRKCQAAISRAPQDSASLWGIIHIVAIREVVQYPAEVLTRPCRKIGAGKLAEMRELIADMMETMQQAGGVGLAAPQVGVSLRVIVAYRIEREEVLSSVTAPAPPRLRAYLNPRITRGEGEELDEEGCLSFGKLVGLIPRYTKIWLRYQDDELKEHSEVLEGLDARIVQHEVDHLNGILISDRTTVPLYEREEEKEESQVAATGSDADTA